MKNLLIILIIICFFVIAYFILKPQGERFSVEDITDTDWYLFTDSISNFSSEPVKLDGYESVSKCLAEGSRFTKNKTTADYWCGQKCKYDFEYETEFCGKICTEEGCKD